MFFIYLFNIYTPVNCFHRNTIFSNIDDSPAFHLHIISKISIRVCDIR